MGKFTDALQMWTNPVKSVTRLPRALTGNLDSEEKNRLAQEKVDFWNGVMNVTQPFRQGGNILIQNYAPLVRGLTGGDPWEKGKLEKWASSSLTEDEQRYIQEKPYEAALKSSAGMASYLAPFASRAAPAANLLGRTGQIAGRGFFEGALGGYGYSREGKELQDTLTGGAIGTLAELGGNYLLDPNYRSMVNEGYRGVVPSGSKYQAALQLGDNADDIVYDLGFDGNSETIDIYPASNMKEDTFKPVGQVRFSVDEDMGMGVISDIYVDSDYQRKGLATNALKKLREEYPNIKFETTLQTDEGAAFFNSPQVREILDPKMGNLSESGDIYYHQSQSKEPFSEFKQRGDKGYKKAYYSQAGEGIYFSQNKDLVQSKYGKEGGQLISAKLKPKKKLDLGEYDAMYFDGTRVNSGEIVVENFRRSQQGLPELPEPDIKLTEISKEAKEWLAKNGYDMVEGMKGEMWSAPEAVVLDKSIIEPVSGMRTLAKRDYLETPYQERLMDNRTLGEAIDQDSMHLAQLEGEGVGPGENLMLRNDDLPKQPVYPEKDIYGYPEQLRDIQRRIAEEDLLEGFLQKYRDLGIIK